MRHRLPVLIILCCSGCTGDLNGALEDQGARADLPRAHDGRADGKGKSDDGAGQRDQAQGGGDLNGPRADRAATPPDRSIPDQWTYDGSIGKPCQGWQDCTTPYICTTNTHTGATYCTLPCDPCATTPCPAGTGCQPAGGGYFICALGYTNTDC